MRISTRLAVVLALAVAAFATVAAAPADHQCPCKGAMMTHKYDAAAEATVKGALATVDEHECPMRGQKNVHLVLKSEGGDRLVHVGPAAYVTEQGFAFAKSDEVEVVGSPMTCGETTAIMAREIRKGGRSLVLRDAQGQPQWAPAGRHHGHDPHHH